MAFWKKSEAAQVRFLNLRYTLLPYIYSLCGDITFNNGTMMRGLMFDFPEDEKACKSTTSYMFGKEFLVTPIVKPLEENENLGIVIGSKDLYDENKSAGGLTAEYYNGINFNKLLAKTKDAKIDFIWDDNEKNLESEIDGSVKGLNSDEFSIRWSGFVKIDKPGTYTFITASDDGARLWIDGKQVINDWEKHAKTINSAQVKITKAGLIPIKLEYFEDKKLASISLNWQQSDSEKPTNTYPVYLPENTRWYDFWTGEKFNGGQTVLVDVAYDIMPLFVKEGSIIPFGPKQEWVNQIKPENIVIRIYPGKDGKFELYEDEGNSYDYEKGVYSTISLKWNETEQTFTIGKRKGEFPGMLKTRNFHIVFVGKGDLEEQKISKTVEYTGEELKIKFREMP